MSETALLVRLSWRPWALLFDLLAIFSFAVALVVASGVLSPGPGGSLEPFAWVHYQVLIVLPAAVGTILGYRVRTLLITHTSWTLPGVRRAFARPLELFAAISSIAAAAISAALGSEIPLLVALCLALLSFAAGTVIFDFALPRWQTRGALAALIVGVLAGPHTLSAAAWVHPLVLLGAALIGTPWLVRRICDVELHRARVLVPSSALGSDYAPVVRGNERVRGPRGRAATATWSGGPIRGLSRWVRAAGYELCGSAGLGRLSSPITVASAATAFLVLICALDGLEVERSFERAIQYVAYAFYGIELAELDSSNQAPFYGPYLLATGALCAMGWPFGEPLRRGVAYPLDRRDRALVTWRLCATQLALGAAVLAVAYGLTAEVALRVGGVERPAGALPEWLQAILLAALVAPVSQWIRARFFGLGNKCYSAVVYGAVQGATVLVLYGVVRVARALWTDAESSPLAAQLVGLVAVAVAVQLLFRALLLKRFERCDLT